MISNLFLPADCNYRVYFPNVDSCFPFALLDNHEISLTVTCRMCIVDQPQVNQLF